VSPICRLGFKTVDLTDAQADLWEKERDALEGDKSKYHKLGWQRNLFGMKVKDVMSVNPPAPWLAEALQVELRAQGVQLVKKAEDADLVVGGTLAYINIDLYMATWCNLVVDLVITAGDDEGKTHRIHTAGGQTAWDGGADESFEVLQQCEQRFSAHAILKIVEALKSAAQSNDASVPHSVPLEES
jgi:hypothetical protein